MSTLSELFAALPSDTAKELVNAMTTAAARYRGCGIGRVDSDPHLHAHTNLGIMEALQALIRGAAMGAEQRETQHRNEKRADDATLGAQLRSLA